MREGQETKRNWTGGRTG